MDATTPPPGATRRNILFVTGGQVALLALWFAATVLLARKLGPEALGFYALCTRAIKLLTTLIGDPLDLAVLRDAPTLLKSDRAGALSLVRAVFWIRCALGAATILISALAPAVISLAMFRSPEFGDLILLTAFGVLTDLLLRSVVGYLQASERFARFMTVNAVWQIVRAGAILLLIVAGMITYERAVVVYVATPLIAFAVGLPFLPRDLFKRTPPSLKQLAAVANYGKWIAAASALAAIYDCLSVFMLSWLRDERQVGIFAAALTLAIIPDFLNGAVQTVITPKIAPAHASGTFAALFKRYVAYSIPLGGFALLVALPLSGPFIRTVLSVRFTESIDAFKILLIATVFDVALSPLPRALLSFVTPRVMPAINLAALVIVGAGCAILIPRWGATGAATAVLLARVAVTCLTLVLAARLLRGGGGRRLAV